MPQPIYDLRLATNLKSWSATILESKICWMVVTTINGTQRPANVVCAFHLIDFASGFDTKCPLSEVANEFIYS